MTSTENRSTEPEVITIHVGGTTPEHLVGQIVETPGHGHRHWRYTTAAGYRSPFLFPEKGGAASGLITNHFLGLAEREPHRRAGHEAMVPRLEPVDGVDGVAHHVPVFEIYQCPPGCPEHPPVIVCAHDGHLWPCEPVRFVVAELEHQADQAEPGDGLRARARHLATAGGRL